MQQTDVYRHKTNVTLIHKFQIR